MTECPKCLRGRCSFDRVEKESVCVNCGWRPRPAVVLDIPPNGRHERLFREDKRLQEVEA